MSNLSQSAFLQALGWATLSSFWQMAVLWCCFQVANQLFKLSDNKKYVFAVTAIASGFLWFLLTFAFYFKNGLCSKFSLASQPLLVSSHIFQAALTAASVAYLALLIVPAYRLFGNCCLVRVLKTKGLQKPNVWQRLFVQKIVHRLGIKKPVGLFLSEKIKSPVMIGFFKPVILLPIACVNHLSVPQVEAILLHELSHIKRHDYLINIFIQVVHTFLYFNPFVTFFMRLAEAERETCCDQMVLQFGYDKISYASALLTLEKFSVHTYALAATGKKNLLTRIEKIAGLEKKPVFNLNYFAGIAAVILLLFVFNSITLRHPEKTTNNKLSFNNIANPFFFLSDEAINHSSNKRKTGFHKIIVTTKKIEFQTKKLEPVKMGTTPDRFLNKVSSLPDVIPVVANKTDETLNNQEKEQVKVTVETTKKILTNNWPEVEKSIADGMTNSEKAKAKQQYFEEVEKIDWQNVENLLKADYNKINWQVVTNFLTGSLVKNKLDSLQTVYENVLREINKTEMQSDSLTSPLPFPDQSVKQIEKISEGIQHNLKIIKAIKTKQVIKL